MNPLELVHLDKLMMLSPGSNSITIGVIDGPPQSYNTQNFKNIKKYTNSKIPGETNTGNFKNHADLIINMISGTADSPVRPIAPKCRLVIYPTFKASKNRQDQFTATVTEVTQSIHRCIDQGVRIINLSAALTSTSIQTQMELQESLDAAANHDVLIVAATGNQGNIASTPVTKHPAVIPVVAYDLKGRPSQYSNISNSIAINGVGAPGELTMAVGMQRYEPLKLGTSIAAPYVTGTAALLLSIFPNASVVDIRHAIRVSPDSRRGSLIPPLLNAWKAYHIMAN